MNKEIIDDKKNRILSYVCMIIMCFVSFIRQLWQEVAGTHFSNLIPVDSFEYDDVIMML